MRLRGLYGFPVLSLLTYPLNITLKNSGRRDGLRLQAGAPVKNRGQGSGDSEQLRESKNQNDKSKRKDSRRRRAYCCAVSQEPRRQQD
jgi:hypothetical protein